MYHRDRQGALARFFAGLTEHTFQARLGVADPPLTDYLSDLLARFVRCDAIYRIRDLSGRPLEEVAEMLIEADGRIGDARREIHRHVGDFTLFWTGVYPEALPRLRAPDRKDHLVDYCAQGKRAYYIASTIDADVPEDEPGAIPGDVLQRLAEQFEICMHGLREVRRLWEQRDGGDPGVRPMLIN